MEVIFTDITLRLLSFEVLLLETLIGKKAYRAWRLYVTFVTFKHLFFPLNCHYCPKFALVILQLSSFFTVNNMVSSRFPKDQYAPIGRDEGSKMIHPRWICLWSFGVGVLGFLAWDKFRGQIVTDSEMSPCLGWKESRMAVQLSKHHPLTLSN